MNTDRIDMQEIARQACGMPPAPVMECADAAAQLRRERDAWATHCKRAEAEVADLMERNRMLQARLDALDMRDLIGDLRELSFELRESELGNALKRVTNLLRKIDLESQ